jgi:hypothetical protein
MGQESSKAVVLATILIVGISAAAYLSLTNSDTPVDTENSSGIASLTILANSTDLLYPELAEAAFVYLWNDTWQVNANFMNNSIDWYENLEIYDQTFTVNSQEVKSIDDALYEGLNKATPSNLTAMALLSDSSPHIWFQIEIVYTNGSWIFITAFQTEIGHIITNNGTGHIDTNLINGTVLERLAVFDCLVLAVYSIFSNHLDTATLVSLAVENIR